MSKFTKKILLTIMLLILAFIISLLYEKIILVLKYILKILLPLLLSFSFAYVLNPIVNFLTKYLKKRGLATCVTALFVLSISYIFFSYFIPFISNEIKSFLSNYDTIITSIKNKIDTFSQKFDFLPIDYQPNYDNIKDMINKYIENFDLSPNIIINKVIDLFSVIIVLPMLTIYLLMDFEKIKNKIKNVLIKNNKEKTYNYLSEINKSLYAYIKTVIIIMVIMVLVSTLSFVIIGLDYPLLFGTFIAITNIIPYLGPYIGGALPVLYALVQSTNKAILVLTIIVIIQVIESDIISPLLHSKNNEIHPLLIIVGLLIFGKLFSIVGLILCVPILKILQITNKYIDIPILCKFKENTQ